MKQRLLLAVGALLLVGTLIFGAAATEAATTRYKFVIRGIVTAVDAENNTITLNVTAAPGKAFEDLSGKSQEFVAKDAKFHKREGAKDKRVTFSKVLVGQEVGFHGLAKDDDKYYITWLRIHDRSFSIVGNLNEHKTDTARLTLSVTSSTYKETKYKGAEIVMTYDGDTKFKTRNGGDLVADDVGADGQRVKVIGKITGSNTWEVDSLVDDYTKTK